MASEAVEQYLYLCTNYFTSTKVPAPKAAPGVESEASDDCEEKEPSVHISITHFCVSICTFVLVVTLVKQVN